MDADKTVIHITNWLKTYSDNSNTKGFVVGVSGGIDSAVVSTLCALTNKKVVLMEMPIHQDEAQVNRGKKHMDWLCQKFNHVEQIKMDLTAPYDGLENSIEKVADLSQNKELALLTLSNTRSRLRMLSLYAIAGLNGLLVCGTGNKVEDFGIGFFTKYGDGGVDLSPIADLMKSEVYSLGAALGVNEDILNARPTDGLWNDGRTDEDQIGATYDELEWAMQLQEEYGNQPAREHFSNERQHEVWNIYIRRYWANKHKMDPIPVCKIIRD